MRDQQLINVEVFFSFIPEKNRRYIIKQAVLGGMYDGMPFFCDISVLYEGTNEKPASLLKQSTPEDCGVGIFD